MSLEELLTVFSNQKISYWAEGESIRCKAPKGILTQELRDSISEHKEALLSIVNVDNGPIEHQMTGNKNTHSSNQMHEDHDRNVSQNSSILPTERKANKENLNSVCMPPRNNLDEIIIDIWKNTLGVDQINIDDNFFNLGGNSLFATKIACSINEIFNIDMEKILRLMFTVPTVAGFADLLIEHESKPGEIESIARVHRLVNSMSEEEILSMLIDKRNKVNQFV